MTIFAGDATAKIAWKSNRCFILIYAQASINSGLPVAPFAEIAVNDGGQVLDAFFRFQL